MSVFGSKSIILFVAVACISLVLAGCSRETREDREFSNLSDDFIAWFFEAHPVAATAEGEHAYDNRIDDLGAGARGAELESLRSYLSRLETIDHERLSRDNGIDVAILRNRIDRMIFSLEKAEDWRRNPLLYTRLLGNSIYLLIARDFAPAEVRLGSAASRLGEFPRVVDQAIANLDNPPVIHTETAILQNRGTIALLDRDLRAEAQRAGIETAPFEEALGSALAALERFQDYLEDDLYFASKGDFRLGGELYREKLRLTLMTDMTSEKILEMAQVEKARLHDEMFALAAPIYLEMNPGEKIDGVSVERKMMIIRTVLDYIAGSHAEPEGLLEACKTAYAEAERFVREHDIIELPDEPLEIVWAPEFSRGVAVAGLRSPGPLDRGMKAFYVVSPPPEDWTDAQVESFLREYNDEMIRILTIHEAMPGHYVQLAYANRFPSLLRAVFSSGTFVEGWAVYTERMMLEEGYGNQNPRLWLQRKKFYLRAVINAILDAGIHMGGMSEYEAMKLMIEEGFQEESEAAGKWRRACLTSAQLSTYFVGYREVSAIRERAELEWGEEFDLGKFHEKLLGYGSPPPRLVEELLFEKR
jgi:uncharacterized protein (DUF885 family)